MRLKYYPFLFVFLLVSVCAFAQSANDSLKQGRNMYGDLLNDSRQYNKVYPYWKPFTEVIAINAATWSVDKYLVKASYAQVTDSTWNINLHGRWEWDNDRFGINFLGHPYSGTMYFNAGRSMGYSYLQSIPLAVEGSLIWEYFGENTKPSYNDIINTPVNGVFFGEIFYRLSSNILDDRTRGAERTLREIAAGLIDPVRGINRLLQGKTHRVTKEEVYQKEPLNVTLWGGVINKNENGGYFSGVTNPVFAFQFDYGNPFEDRARKPFDVFRLRVGLRFGYGRKILDQATGYGFLFGKNIKRDNPSTLVGAFQYYDYYDNNSFELAAIGLGFGTLARFDINSVKKTDLFLGLHLGVVPLAGTSEHPDTSTQVRDYNFGNGLSGKVEATLNVWGRVTGRMVATYYYIHQNVNGISNSFIGVLQPNVSVRVFHDVHLGYEESIYLNDHLFHSGLPGSRHINSREEKVYVMFYIQDKKRSGMYH